MAMSKRLARLVAVAALFSLGSVPAAAQGDRGVASSPDVVRAPSGPVPRAADGRPDMRGHWIAPPLRSSNILEEHPGGFGIQAGKSVVLDPPDGKIPYQPWALAERDRRRRPENNYEDNEGKCILSGVPRIMLFSFRILYFPDTVLFLSDYIAASRIFRMAGPRIPDGIRLYMGDPVARWEGDTLVVESKNFNGKTWFALGGDFASEAMQIVERFTMPDANTIAWQATITDANVFTRPWTLQLGPYTRDQAGDQDEEEIEDSCHEGNADLDNLKNVYDRAREAGRK
jgi:hypothetical protein